MKILSRLALVMIGIEVLLLGAPPGRINSASIAISGDTSVTASFVESALFYFEDFESYPTGSNPLDWLDTAAKNSMSEDDSLFQAHQVDGNQVLGTVSDQTNIHSHYLGAGASSLTSYQYAGRMRIANASAGIGVTFFSQYGDQDAYYRLRRYGTQAFHFRSHGTTVSGDTNTGVVPAANTWYNFIVEVEDTGTRTELRAKLWAEGTPEPAGWQADAFDDSPSRLTAGAFGVWSYLSGGKYWDDLSVTLLSPPVTYTLTTNTAGNGQVVADPDLTDYPEGTVVSLTALPDPGHSFGGWSGDLSGTNNPATITMDGDKTVTANFTQDEYTLTVDFTGNGAITVDPLQPTYNYGDIVTLTAVPGADWLFTGWSGDLSGSSNPATLTMDGDKSVTATFAEQGHTLTLNISGNGDVTTDPDLVTYPDGTVVSLTALPDPGHSFGGWSGDLSGTNNPATITMDGDKTVTANFTSMPTTSITFAALGDYGGNSSDEQSVADLVTSRNPDFIITTGDNSYGNTPIDDNIGQYYSDYIGDYVGAYGPGADSNRFFPSLGNHDYSDGGGFDAYIDYFTLPGNERYYDFVWGPVHFFVIDSNPAGTGGAPGDGRSPTSPQALWLQSQLAASTAPWKIVYMHHSPYSSGAFHGSDAAMQWPYEDWGATAVLAGHNHIYERVLRDDNGDGVIMPYFVTGLGGWVIHDIGTPVPGSQVTYNGDYGTMFITASPTELSFEFYSIAGGGTLIDSYSMISWVHLSSANGDLPPPTDSDEQTATLILDVNKDDLDDFVIGARKAPGPSLVWYQRHRSGWIKHVIDDTVLSIEAGGAFHDIDGDGDLDVVMGGNGNSNQVWWWENPYPDYPPDTPWTRREIKNSGANKHHDQIFGDFDGDGSVELVFWNQGAQSLYLAEIPPDPRNTEPWPLDVIYTWISGEHEGLAKADIDGDGKVDIVGGGRWFKHNDGTSYTANIIDDGQRFTRAAVGQLKTGGRPEVVFVVGDGVGRLQMYDWTDSGWTAHDLLGFDVDHGHSLEVADINNDGKQDIFNAEMRLNGGNDQAKMRIFYGNGDGTFTMSEIATGIGNHESKIGDLDSDGDLDILGKPFNWDTPRLDVWLNEGTNPDILPLDQWQRHVIDGNRPWRAIFVTAADVDGDDLEDVITGGWWYKNPGDPSQSWTRNEIGSPLNNMATVFDFDGDGDKDILGTAGIGSSANNTFYWAHNSGSGQFTILDNISSGDGNYLQGVAVDRFQNNELGVALSWHLANTDIQQFMVPADPVSQTWPLSQISTVSQNEELSSGDIDKDGDVDLLLGTKWLRNEGSGWTAFDLYTPNGQPDRNRLADINDDGKLDAVVGYEAISVPGKLAWYEQGATPTATWTEHIVAAPAIIGPMSLDVADVDGDGDIDIVVGEHNTADPASASLYIFENLDGDGISWVHHIVYTGDEHHDGAQVVDIDRDGDLDIVSIGWTHDDVILYENKALDGSGVTYDLVVNKVGPGSVQVEPTGPYSYNDVVSLTATADPGWVFSNWSGDLSGNANPIQLTMNTNRVVTATFVELTTHTLAVAMMGDGSVTRDPDKPLYDYGETVTLAAVADPGWVFSHWSGDLSGNDNPAQLVMDGDKSVTAHFTSAYYAEDFEGYNAGADPVDWYDSAANNSMAQDDSLFEVFDLSGDKAFGTNSTETNIHSHYMGAGSENFTGYRYSGRMMISNASGGVGVTIYSQYPAADEYYRLRRHGNKAFHLSPHGTTLSGDTTTGVVPQANTWYQFIIEAENVGASTQVRAKVWQEGTLEPAAWQADAVDSSGGRLAAGTFGLWSYTYGSKYWDDLIVLPLLP
jgi:uncharacterized repeat protein (TIGR02543 family)